MHYLLLVVAVCLLAPSVVRAELRPEPTGFGRFKLGMKESELATMDGVRLDGELTGSNKYRVNQYSSYDTLRMGDQKFPVELFLEVVNGELSEIHLDLQLSDKRAIPYFIAVAMLARETLRSTLIGWSIDHDCLDLTTQESNSDMYAGTLFTMTNKREDNCFLYFDVEGVKYVRVSMNSKLGMDYYMTTVDGM
jgi:hypothetical protein